MKRKQDDSDWKGIKKLKSNLKRFRGDAFPEVKKPFLEVDFHYYIASHDPDIIFTNGKVGFHSHKRILKSLSPIWKHMLEGDQSIRVLKIKDLSNGTIEIIQKTLESAEDAIDKVFDWNFLPTDRQTAELQMDDLLLLAGKFSFVLAEEILMHTFFSRYFQEVSLDMKCKHYKMAQNFNLKNIANKISPHLWKGLIDSESDWKSFPEKVVEDFMTRHSMDFVYDEEGEMLFENFTRYALYKLENNNSDFVKMIEEMKQPETGWEDKVEFERFQKATFWKILLELKK